MRLNVSVFVNWDIFQDLHFTTIKALVSIETNTNYNLNESVLILFSRNSNKSFRARKHINTWIFFNPHFTRKVRLINDILFDVWEQKAGSTKKTRRKKLLHIFTLIKTSKLSLKKALIRENATFIII